MKQLRANIPPAELLEDPLYSQRNPHQTFLLLLSVIASIPLLQGRAQSALLEAALSNAAVIGWGCALLTGSLLALVGEFWPGRTWTSMVLERAGLALVGGAAAIYAVVTWSSVGSHEAVSELLPWALWFAIPSAAGVAVIGAYRRPRYDPPELASHVAVAAWLGALVGGYAGAVWHTDDQSSGVTYVVSIQVAYAASCAWRVAPALPPHEVGPPAAAAARPPGALSHPWTRS